MFAFLRTPKRTYKTQNYRKVTKYSYDFESILISSKQCDFTEMVVYKAILQPNQNF